MRKGEHLHRKFGAVFFGSMLMSALGVDLALFGSGLRAWTDL